MQKPHRTNPKILARSYTLRYNLTEAEDHLWMALRANQVGGVHFRRQHAVGPYVVDFYSPGKKLVMEVDGDQHQDQHEYDAERTAYLETQGYRVLRFWNEDVVQDLDEEVKRIMMALR